MGALITRGLATYAELDTVLSCKDAMRLLDMLRVRDYNEWLYQKEAEKKMRKDSNV